MSGAVARKRKQAFGGGSGAKAAKVAKLSGSSSVPSLRAQRAANRESKSAAAASAAAAPPPPPPPPPPAPAPAQPVATSASSGSAPADDLKAGERESEELRTLLALEAEALGATATHRLEALLNGTVAVSPDILKLARQFHHEFAARRVCHLHILSTQNLLHNFYDNLATHLKGSMIPTLPVGEEPSITLRSMMAEAKGQACEKLGYHGTPLWSNAVDIAKNGFLNPTKKGQHGFAVYTSRLPSYSHKFTGSDKKARFMFGCKVLAHAGELFGHIYAVLNPRRTLPLVLFRYNPQ